MRTVSTGVDHRQTANLEAAVKHLVLVIILRLIYQIMISGGVYLDALWCGPRIAALPEATKGGLECKLMLMFCIGIVHTHVYSCIS